jgi:hypothetical protein
VTRIPTARARTFALTLLAGVTALYASMAGAAAPQPFEAVYSVSRGGIELGSVRMDLRRATDDSFIYRTRTEPSGIVTLFTGEIVERSLWRYEDGEIIPLQYRYRRREGVVKRSVDATFDWSSQRVLTQEKDQNWSLDVPPGTLDKLLTNLAFLLDLQEGTGEYLYTVADGNDLKQYQYTLIGRESLSTAVGELDTVRFQRRKVGKKPKTTLWCAPELDYFPVHVERRDDGTVYRMSLVSLHQGNTPRYTIAERPDSQSDPGSGS